MEQLSLDSTSKFRECSMRPWNIAPYFAALSRALTVPPPKQYRASSTFWLRKDTCTSIYFMEWLSSRKTTTPLCKVEKRLRSTGMLERLPNPTVKGFMKDSGG